MKTATTRTVADELRELWLIEQRINELAGTVDVFISFDIDPRHIVIMGGVKTRELDCRTVANLLSQHGYYIEGDEAPYQIRMAHSSCIEE